MLVPSPRDSVELISVEGSVSLTKEVVEENLIVRTRDEAEEDSDDPWDGVGGEDSWFSSVGGEV